ncbi:ABC transporter permease [Clostridium estertheticum]|uniref:ABC transporter permease n=1 Tax=Clostridium estertheticum TaxID=238834 RepID=UPI0013EE4588|nr:FtsX-like permease family protein [Clostridium estertheticum]MBZ9607930.1 ABC transporter permease [Clostridium estertheticum]
MNIINALTLRHMKLNKKRTIVTIIGVILSVSMITAIPTSVMSFLSMMQQNTIEDTGNWHVRYNNLRSENINVVMNDKNTANAALSRNIGYSKLEGSKNKNKPYLFIEEYDKQGMESFNLDLVKGRLPKKSNEIVISSQISENGGVAYKVGDVLKLDVGERYEDGNKVALGQDCSFENQSKDKKGEKFIEKYKKEYTITGIISKPNFEPYWSPGYTVIPYLDRKELAPTDTVNMSVVWKNVSKKVNTQANELSERIGVSGDSKIYNSELLRYYGIINDVSLVTLAILAGIMITIIIIGSVALIYNSFAISLSERSRHLRMLASVGATKKQKSKSVFFEGFVVGVIGIPIGVFLGTVAMGITFKIVQPLIEGFGIVVKLKLVISPGAILVAILLSIITILISAYIPAKRTSKISPIDGIRQSRDIKLTGRVVKTSKLTRFIFGFEAELGLKNLKRNNHRYKATIFSLVISIVMFLSVSSLSLMSRKSAESAANIIPYDLNVFVSSSGTSQEKKNFFNAITKVKYVDESIIDQTMNDVVVDVKSGLIPDEIKANIEPTNKEKKIETYETHFQIKSIDEIALKKYAKETGTDITGLKDIENPSGILINTVSIKADNKYKRMNRFSITPGEKLKLTYPVDDKINEYSVLLEIVALADKTPIGETMLTNIEEPMIIVSEKVYASIQGKLPKISENDNVDMFIKSSNPTKLVESIKEYQNNTSIASVNIIDFTIQDKQNRQMRIFIQVFLYGFIAIITAICVANIFNTISTSISLRRREFAMFKSVGMTPKSFNKMINYESWFYGIKSLLYGLPISFGMMYLIYRVLKDSFDLQFAVPWGSVIVTIIAVFAIVRSTMIYASSKIKKENIIEVLKTENI